MAKKTRKFKTEVQQLLDLVIHSLYSKKEIFLRELLSNASDAIDRARFESLTDAELVGDHDWKIKISVDEKARTLTISDNGIGMNADELDTNIGTIANSGTRAFLDNLKSADKTSDAEFIGQFGVGFYASFMVADVVEVITLRAGENETAYRWRSKGDGQYTVEETERETSGSDIILHLREDEDEFLSDSRIRTVVGQYSNYITHPIVIDATRSEGEGDDAVEVTEEETLNSMKAIWKRDKKDVTTEEYKEFYSHISHDFNEPFETIHFSAEGATEFQALLFVPAQAPFDMYYREGHKGLQLYVKNVFITDDCKELIPEYLRFVKGVIDSSDLPLNVSREMLQDDVIMHRIRKSIVSKILGALKTRQKKKPDEYRTFFEIFGRVIKEGINSDFENADKLKDLLVFHSSTSEGKLTATLKEYVERMPEGQKEIYYLTAENLEAAQHSPLLETFKDKGYEVLFFVDPVDEWISQSLTQYGDKDIKAIDRGDINLDNEEDAEALKKDREAVDAEHKDLLEFIQTRLDKDIETVRFSQRLTESPCCLVTGDGALNATMERMMRAMNQEVPPSKRVLELNPKHTILKQMKALFEKDKESDRLGDYVDLLYGQALILEGSPVKAPQSFARIVSDLMMEGATK